MTKVKIAEGKLATTGGGVGFLMREGVEDDIRIEEGNLGVALHGDAVRIELRPEPRVVKVLSRPKERFVGVLDTEKSKMFLIPDDKRIHVDFFVPKPPREAGPGKKALVELIKWDNPGLNPEVRVLKVIGKKGDHDVEMESIVLEKGIDTTFPPEVEKEAEKVKESLGKITDEEVKKRRDFRGITTFTIDPSDAKDFDDALSIKKAGEDKWEVGIHIADVGHYVRAGSVLDKEARERAFSTYLVDRTIPMLPEELSNDLASLNPGEDKLTFSATFLLDKNAEVKERWFGKTIIHSDKRFTYEDAQETLDKGAGEFASELLALNNLANRLSQKKMAAGAIDFDQSEFAFELDDSGKPVKIWRKERLETHKLIEEFMLLANKEVAAFISKKINPDGKSSGRALIYRVHDTPDKEKIDELQIFLKALGYELGQKGKNVTGKALNKLFMDIEGTSEESLIKTAAIRAMAKAAYSTKNIGHFGLGFGFYTHFTSPIRRYADLLVHRLLERCLAGETISTEEREHYEKIAGSLSGKEVSIVEAERDSIKYKQVEFMKEHIGKTFDGVVSGVSEWGIFVSEIETGAEGLVRIRDMKDDFYELEKKKYRLVGKKTKKTYSLGDKVRIRVLAADLDRKKLDYAFA